MLKNCLIREDSQMNAFIYILEYRTNEIRYVGHFEILM